MNVPLYIMATGYDISIAPSQCDVLGGQGWDLVVLVSVIVRRDVYVSWEQALSICNIVSLSNFNICPLLWILCNKSAKKKMNILHKRVLMILHWDYDSSFQSLLERSNSFTIHVKNIQKLMMKYTSY